MSRIKFPSITDVAYELRRVNQQDSAPTSEWSGTDDREIEVRLGVDLDGTWIVLWGDSSYDQRHYAMCGSSSVPGDCRRFASRDVAKDLIEQCKEQYPDTQESEPPTITNTPETLESASPETIIALDAIEAKHPEAYKLIVGMPATIGIGADRYPAVVVSATPGLKQIGVNYADHTEYHADSSEGPDRVFSLRKDGRYRPVGSGKNSGYYLHLGTASNYRDPSF